MEKRRLGRTGHDSSVAILGGVVFAQASPEESEKLLTTALQAGVNHIDIAPSYGDAERRLGPLMPAVRDRVFLACKTGEREGAAARAELERSLVLLQTDHFDLYQLHGITAADELRTCMRPGGAVAELMRARDQGLVRYIGITGHFEDAPRLFHELLEEVDLDTVMFPVNSAMWRITTYRADAERLLKRCQERDMGVMAIKPVARGPWTTDDRPYQTWYEPYDSPALVNRAVSFTLSLPVHAFATAGEPRLLRTILEAAENYQTLTPEDIETEIHSSASRPLLRPAAAS